MFDAIISALKGIANALGFAYLAAIFVGGILVALLVAIVITRLSYETKLLKAIDGFNAYLRGKPYVGDDNLIEFNNRMKEAPGVLRNRWQMFVLNREDGIAKYINLDSCVEKPLRTSTIDRVMKNFTAISVFLVFLSAVFSAALVTDAGLGTAQALFRILAVPAVIVMIAVIGIIVVRSLKGAVQSDLYEYFHIFEQNMTRAVTTLPPYIDYEILFTRKEIRDSIPVLQQYLEKRAIIEQEELEKARKNAIEVEGYNFDELGLNGALVLERAMRECEVYLGTKRRLKVECDNIETERANYAKNYEMTSKDYQRKLQISRENLESLKKQQESSTNRIESNYIKKQQADEIKKQSQIEKDADAAALKFKEEQEALKAEIQKRQEEIETHRTQIEDAMKLEFKNYAKLMFAKLQEIAAEKMGNDYSGLVEENKKLKGVIKRAKSGGIAEIESVAEEIEEHEYEIEAVKGKNIPEFISKGFDISAETNFDIPTQKPAPKESKTEEFKTEEFKHEPAQTRPTISGAYESKADSFDFGGRAGASDKPSEGFRPTMKPAESGSKSAGGDFKPSEFKLDDVKTSEFKFDDDFKPSIKFVDENASASGTDFGSPPKIKPADDSDGGRDKSKDGDFSDLYNRIYNQMKDESGDTAHKNGDKNEEGNIGQNEDILLSVNQKLQEESKKLKEQKAALNNEISETISRMGDKPVKAQAAEPIDDVQFMLDSMKENLKKQQPNEPAKAAKPPLKAAGQAAPKTATRPAPARTTPAAARPARPAAAQARPLPRRPAGTAAPAARRRADRADDGHSVDDIAGEMDRLINSNKKKR